MSRLQDKGLVPRNGVQVLLERSTKPEFITGETYLYTEVPKGIPFVLSLEQHHI